MSEPRIRVMITESEIRALLNVLPRCRDCDQRGEVVINTRLLCITCAAQRHGGGRAESPAWTNAADALECAISPLERKPK
jgi:hypothetical protein